jgi:SH3 domain-containing YSC84-like protein 1
MKGWGTMRHQGQRHGRILGGLVVLVLCVIVSVVGAPRSARADDAKEAQQLVDKARLTFDAFIGDKEMGPALKDLVKKAQGILVYPSVLRGAFIIGASGGSGVFLAHDAKTKKWAGPAFYTIGQASFGLQAGGDASEIVLVALTERGVSSLLATSAKLGADASVAAGPVGAGAQAATQNLSADIVSYSRAKGVYAGVSVDGAVVATRDALNKAYYKKEVTPTDILIKRAVTNKGAAGLIQAVAKAAGK